MKKKPIEGTQGLIAGKKRQGKSFFVKKELIPRLKEVKPVVVLDRKHEYAGRNKVDSCSSWNVFKSSKEFFNSAIESGKISGVNIVLCNSDIDYNLAINFIKKLEKPISLIIDEAWDIYISPEFKRARSAAVGLARFGATFGIDSIMITQRTMDVPKDIRTQFDWLISFRQGGKGDTDAIEEMGFDNGESARDLGKREKVLFSYLPDFLDIPDGEFKTINR